MNQLRELLKGKEMKIKQLEYENIALKKKAGSGAEEKMQSMIAEDSDASDASSDHEGHTPSSVQQQQIVIETA